jgi:3-dehydroquinate synthetase
VKRLLKKLGMPATIPADITKETVMDLIKRDKKAVDKWPKFVLVNELGRVYQVDDQWAVDVPPALVEKVLQRLY